VKILAATLILIVIFSVQPKAEAYSYRSYYQYKNNNGYFKSNGTYVNPYRRGVSNNIREDNVNYYYKNIFGRRVYPNR